ncbi:MAG: WYL domain-containing protein [Spirochaetes bacterium]|nr:WYL domain-containing protein [Spirochaetota bacterium]
MTPKKPILDPEKRLKVTKRYLHALALLQGSGKDPEDMNSNSLADILSLDEKDESKIADTSILKYIKEHLIDELGIDINLEKGARRIVLDEPLDPEMAEKIAGIYSSFVVRDSAREIVLKNFLKKHPYDGLWMLARIYFAILAKRRISFDYSPDGIQFYQNIVNPFHLVFRNNNLYLACRVLSTGQIFPLTVSKINNLKILDKEFDENIPSLEEIFKDTLGAYIGKKHNVKIKFAKEVYTALYDVLGILDPKYTEIKGGAYYTAEFAVSDDRYLCMQLFLHGNKVEILEPFELKKTMADMLKSSISVYE